MIGMFLALVGFVSVLVVLMWRKIDNLSAKTDERYEQLDTISIRLDNASIRLDGHLQRLDDTVPRLQGVEQALSTLEARLDTLAGTVEDNTAAIERLQQVLIITERSDLSEVFPPLHVWYQHTETPYGYYDYATGTWQGQSPQIAEQLAAMLGLGASDLKAKAPTSLSDFIENRCDYDLGLLDLSDPLWNVLPSAKKGFAFQDISPFFVSGEFGAREPAIAVPICEEQDRVFVKDLFLTTFLVEDSLDKSRRKPTHFVDCREIFG